MLFPSLVQKDLVVMPTLVDWEGTCKVKDLRIAYLENELSQVIKDRDLYRDKLFSHLGLVESNVSREDNDPKPIHGKFPSPMSLALKYERRDRDLAKKMEEEKARLASGDK